MTVCDGEFLLLKALRTARETPGLDETQLYHIRTEALKVMVKVTKGLNREWRANEEVWSLVYSQMQHCHAIFQQLLDTLQKRFLGEPLNHPIVKDFGAQTSLDAERIDASTSMGEVMVCDDEDAGAVGGQATSLPVVEPDDDVVMLNSDNEFEGEDWTEWYEDERIFQRTQTLVEMSDLTAQMNNHDHVDRGEVRVANQRPTITRNRDGIPNCWICSNDHAVHACKEFLKLTRGDRFRLLASYGDVCHNCFCFGHLADRCWKPDGCRCSTHMCQCGATHGHNSTICAGRRCYRPY